MSLTDLMFTAAALLIQGSACVYGKKVEYLHTLVYQALEFIAEKRYVITLDASLDIRIHRLHESHDALNADEKIQSHTLNSMNPIMMTWMMKSSS